MDSILLFVSGCDVSKIPIIRRTSLRYVNLFYHNKLLETLNEINRMILEYKKILNKDNNQE